MTWAPLLANPFDPPGALTIIEASAAAQRAGAAVHPQVGCRPLEVRVSFDAAGIAIANNPFWKPILDLPKAERRALLASTEFRDELRQMSSGGNFVAALAPSWQHDLPALLAACASTRPLVDRSIADDRARARRAMKSTRCSTSRWRATCACQFGIPIMNVDEDVVGQLLRHPAGIVALSDAGAHVDTLADQGFTTTLLAHWVRELGVLRLEEAVRLVTSVPAALYGLQRARHAARRVAPPTSCSSTPTRIGLERTELVHDLPGGAARLIQRPIGIEHVIVNGERADRRDRADRGAQRTGVALMHVAKTHAQRVESALTQHR